MLTFLYFYRASSSFNNTIYQNSTGSLLRTQDIKDPYSIYFLITRLDIKFDLRKGIASPQGTKLDIRTNKTSPQTNDDSTVFDSNGILANAFPLSDPAHLSTYLDVVSQSQPSDEQYQRILLDLMITNYSQIVNEPDGQLSRTITNCLKDLTAEDLNKPEKKIMTKVALTRQPEEKMKANQMYELMHLAEIFRAGYFSNDTGKVIQNFQGLLERILSEYGLELPLKRDFLIKVTI